MSAPPPLRSCSASRSCSAVSPRRASRAARRRCRGAPRAGSSTFVVAARADRGRAAAITRARAGGPPRAASASPPRATVGDPRELAGVKERVVDIPRGHGPDRRRRGGSRMRTRRRPAPAIRRGRAGGRTARRARLGRADHAEGSRASTCSSRLSRGPTSGGESVLALEDVEVLESDAARHRGRPVRTRRGAGRARRCRRCASACARRCTSPRRRRLRARATACLTAHGR